MPELGSRANLKTAFRLLVQRCGGIEASAAACRVGTTSLHSYYAADTLAFAPADVVADLEAACGVPLVTAALARLAEYELRPVGPGAAGNVTARFAELAGEFGKLFAEAARDFAHPTLAPAERDTLLGHLGELQRTVGEAQASLGAVA